MPSLGQLYNDKDAGLTTRKTYNVPLDKIYAEEGYNVRELNRAHVEEFRDAFIAGEYIPPLAVEVTERGVKVIDGHHRYHGALAAIEMGHDIVRLECKDFVGSEADKIAFMVTSSQGLALTPLERGAAYHRLQNQGWSPSEIATKVKRSESDILQHLQLGEHRVVDLDALGLQHRVAEAVARAARPRSHRRGRVLHPAHQPGRDDIRRGRRPRDRDVPALARGRRRRPRSDEGRGKSPQSDVPSRRRGSGVMTVHAVTPHPALDVTYSLARPVVVHGVNRVAAVTSRPGGKGVNVARLVAAADGEGDLLIGERLQIVHREILGYRRCRAFGVDDGGVANFDGQRGAGTQRAADEGGANHFQVGLHLVTKRDDVA